MREVPPELKESLADRYAIEDKIGEGGMATVYLAHDVRHDRKVAVKVLLPELSAAIGTDRFLEEIRVTAKLQHPHILPLFDSGEAGGFVFYVMPYVEGESLRDLLNRSQHLPIDEAVRIASGVAGALDYAHRNEVIHRDVKPANILLHEGEPVVADFGIALAVSAAGGARFTQTGLSLGTPSYMSPEQATGNREVDGRSDIYALGSMLYEMLAGEAPHAGPTAQAILAKILMEDPPQVTEHRRSVPPNVAAVVRKALERLPADRFQRADSFAAALRDPGFRHAEGLGVERGATPGGQWRAFAIGSAFVAASSLLVLAWTGVSPDGPSVPVLKVSLALSGEELRVAPNGAAVTISADGSTLLYGAYGGPDRNDRWRLWSRRLDQLEATPLPGTEEGVTPAFSPDGMEVAFTQAATRGPIQIVPLAGGSRRSVGDEVVRAGVDWGPDGMLYYVRLGHGISRVPAAGGEPEIVTVVDTAGGEIAHRWLEVLPGSKGAVFSIGRRGGEDGWDIGTVRFGTNEHSVLTRGLYPKYVPTGHLLWALADGTVMAAPFDQDRLELTGRAVPVVEHVNIGAFGAADFTVSETGTFVYLRGRTFEEAPVWVARDGSAEDVPGDWDGALAHPRLSPDGTRMALTINRGTGGDIWIKELDAGGAQENRGVYSGPLSRLTFGGSNYRSAWAADGRELTFISDREGQGVWRTRADGSGTPELVHDDPRHLHEGFLSSDAKWLVYRLGSGGGRDLLARRTDIDTAAVPLAASTEFEETGAALSPDGRWLAFMSNESGQYEIYVRPFPVTSGSKRQVSTAGGREPVWAHSGTELFYKNTSNQLVAVRVELQPTFSVTEQSVLFSTVPYTADGNLSSYDISPDDQRFLMIRSLSGTGDVKLIQNFFKELKEKAGS